MQSWPTWRACRLCLGEQARAHTDPAADLPALLRPCSPFVSLDQTPGKGICGGEGFVWLTVWGSPSFCNSGHVENGEEQWLEA